MSPAFPIFRPGMAKAVLLALIYVDVNIGMALVQHRVQGFKAEGFKTVTGDEASLDESGYLAVAALQSDTEMTNFIQRVCEAHGASIVDNKKLRSFAPHYNFQDKNQSYSHLLKELYNAAWLHEFMLAAGELGDTARLDDRGCTFIVNQRSLHESKHYIHRVLEANGLHLIDEGGMNGYLPFFKGKIEYASLVRHLNRVSWAEHIVAGQEEHNEVLDIVQEDALQAALKCDSWRGLPEEVQPMTCGLFWFTHISKTGGSTVRTYLEENAEIHGWSYHDSLFLEGDFNDTWQSSEAWQDLINDLSSENPKVIFHQHDGCPGFNDANFVNALAQIELDLEAKGCQFTRAITLRGAIGRTVSQLVWDTQSEDMQVTDSSDVMDVFKENIGSNYMANYLMFNRRISPYILRPPTDDNWLLQNARDALHEYQLVGRMEDLDKFMKSINAALGWAYTPAERHDYPDFSGNVVISKGDLKIMTEQNTIDVKLYWDFC